MSGDSMKFELQWKLMSKYKIVEIIQRSFKAFVIAMFMIRGKNLFLMIKETRKISK